MAIFNLPRPPLPDDEAPNGYLAALAFVAFLSAAMTVAAGVFTGILWKEWWGVQWILTILVAALLVASAGGLFWLARWKRAAIWTGSFFAVVYLLLLSALYLEIGIQQTPGGMILDEYLAYVAVWAGMAGFGVFALSRFKKPVRLSPLAAVLLQRGVPCEPPSEEAPLRYYLLRAYSYLFLILALIYLAGFVGWHYAIFRQAGMAPLVFQPLVLLGEVFLVVLASSFFIQLYLYAQNSLLRARRKAEQELRKLNIQPYWKRKRAGHWKRRYVRVQRPQEEGIPFRAEIRHPDHLPVDVYVDGQPSAKDGAS